MFPIIHKAKCVHLVEVRAQPVGWQVNVILDSRNLRTGFRLLLNYRAQDVIVDLGTLPPTKLPQILMQPTSPASLHAETL